MRPVRLCTNAVAVVAKPKTITEEEVETVIVRFRQVQFAKPDAKQFESPAGFKEYSDVQEMMQGVMMKMLGNGGAPAEK